MLSMMMLIDAFAVLTPPLFRHYDVFARRAAVI